MAIGFVEIFILLIMLGLVILPVVALVDMLKRPEYEFTAAGQNRFLWAFVVVLMPFIGSILYFVIGRPQLQALAV